MPKILYFQKICFFFWEDINCIEEFKEIVRSLYNKNVFETTQSNCRFKFSLNLTKFFTQIYNYKNIFDIKK